MNLVGTDFFLLSFLSQSSYFVLVWRDLNTSNDNNYIPTETS